MNYRKPSVVEADFYATRTFLEKYFKRVDKDFFPSEEKYYFDEPMVWDKRLEFNLIKGRRLFKNFKVLSFNYDFGEKIILSKDKIDDEKDKEKVRDLIGILNHTSYGEFIYNFEEFKEELLK